MAEEPELRASGWSRLCAGHAQTAHAAHAAHAQAEHAARAAHAQAAHALHTHSKSSSSLRFPSSNSR
eukprot:840623-Rhodomonas_salina.3